MDDKWKMMIWITLIVSVIVGLGIYVTIIPNQPYILDIKYCDSDELDIEVLKLVCVNLCTEKFNYADEVLLDCYKSCKGI